MKKRKSAKPVTALTRIEKVLGDAVDQVSAFEKIVEKNVRELLISAGDALSKAKEFISLATAIEQRRPAAKVHRTRVPVGTGPKTRTKRAARIRRPSAIHA
jgi:hypothetical protein